MGMIFALQTISDENIYKLIDNPLLIWLFLAPDDPSFYIEEVKKSKKGFFSRLFGKKGNIDNVDVPLLEYKDGERLDVDLDKAWHGLHYLFTQSEWEADPPLNFITSGGKVVGNIDIGYGPGRVLTFEDVSQIDKTLEQIDHDYLRKRFNPDDMMKKKIYPEIWNRDLKEDDSLGYCLEYFDILKSFIHNAVENKLGLLLSFS
ncbi:MAG: YfbM family protein [Desulfamplus sp.]|nr:YfbM family protein [Desulfamplus sp.]